MSSNGDWRDAITADTEAEKAAVEDAGSYAEAQRLIKQYRYEGIPDDSQSQGDPTDGGDGSDDMVEDPIPDTDPSEPTDQQVDDGGLVDRLQDVVDEGVDRAQDIGRDVQETVREEDIDSISDVAGEATERATGDDRTQSVDEQQPTESGQQEPPNKFKGEDFADVVPVEEGTESLGVAGLTAGQIATRYPELYDDPREVVLSSDGPPSIGTNIVETELNVPVGGYRFDPSDESVRERWLEGRDERQEYQERYSEQKEAEENLGVQDGEVEIEPPDPFRDRSVLDQDITLPEGTEQPRQATRELFAERLTRATVEDLAFESDEITLEETEQGFRPTLTGQAREELAEFQQEGYQERFQAEAATLIDTRNPAADIGTEDIRLEETEEGLRPRLTESGESELAEVERERQRLIAAQEVEQQIDGVDVEADDIALFGAEGGGLAPTLTQDIEAEIQRVQREQAAETFSEEYQSRDFSPADITFEQGEATLAESVEQEIRQDRKEQAADRLSERYDTDLSTGDIELTPDGPQLEPGKRDLVADLQTARAAESIEDQLQSEFASRSKFASTTIPEEVRPGAAGELNLTSTDVTTTDSGVGLSESGRAKVRETQLDVAQGRIDRQVPIDVTEDDLTRDDGSITLSEQGRQRLTDYQREQATEQLLQDLEEQTGADLEESDIDVTATEDDGEIQFEAELTKSGQRELAGEQVPGSDLPVIGGGLEAGGEFGERINQERLAIGDEITDRLPEVEVPEVPTPSKEQVTAAAAFGVATPEPVTTGTGSLILGGITLGGLTVAGAQRLSEGLPDQARASATQDQAEIPVPTDGSTRDLTEITIPTGGDFLPTEEQPTAGEAVPQSELPVGGGFQDITEVGIPRQFGDVDPSVLQTGATVGESVTDDSPFSPGPTLPTPGEIGEEISDRQSVERSFPTGGSAVIGQELTEDVTEPELDDATEPVLDQPTEPGVDTGTGTGTGTGVPPGTEPGEGIDGETTRPGESVEDRPFETVTPDLTPGVDALPFATPDVQGTPLLDAPATTGTTTGPGFDFPEEQRYEYPEEPGYDFPEVPTTDTPGRTRRPRIPDLDLDADTGDGKKRGLDIAADAFDNEVLSPGEAFDFDPFD